MQQNNSFTNVLLAIIAIALVMIVIMLAINKQRQPLSQGEQQSLYAPQQTSGLAQTQNSSQSTPQSSNANTTQNPTYSLTSIQVNTQDPHVTSAIPPASQPADFNGHYIVTYIGCGTSCGYPALYDKNTGALYNFPKEMLNGALADGPMTDGIAWMGISVGSPIISLKKQNTNGSVYIEQWKMVGTGFVKVS